MNHKRKHKRPAYRILKRREVNNGNFSRWGIPKRVAKDGLLRREFKKELRSLL